MCEFSLNVEDTTDSYKDFHKDRRNEIDFDIRNKVHNDGNDAWAQNNSNSDYGSNVNADSCADGDNGGDIGKDLDFQDNHDNFDDDVDEDRDQCSNLGHDLNFAVQEKNGAGLEVQFRDGIDAYTKGSVDLAEDDNNSVNVNVTFDSDIEACGNFNNLVGNTNDKAGEARVITSVKAIGDTTKTVGSRRQARQVRKLPVFDMLICKANFISNVIYSGNDAGETAKVVSGNTASGVDGGSRGRESEGEGSEDSTEGTHFEMRGLVVKEGNAPKLRMRESKKWGK